MAFTYHGRQFGGECDAELRKLRLGAKPEGINHPIACSSQNRVFIVRPGSERREQNSLRRVSCARAAYPGRHEICSFLPAFGSAVNAWDYVDRLWRQCVEEKPNRSEEDVPTYTPRRFESASGS